MTAKGNLMIGVGIENRGTTHAKLSRHIDKPVADVSKKSANSNNKK